MDIVPDQEENTAEKEVPLQNTNDSERKAFIKRFGADKGLTAPVLEAICMAGP